MIQQWYCKEKLDASHSKGLKGWAEHGEKLLQAEWPLTTLGLSLFYSYKAISSIAYPPRWEETLLLTTQVCKQSVRITK